MATASEIADRAKRIRIFRNGDPQFYGKDFVLNKRRIRTWDSFLQQVTTDVKFSEAVRTIRTPIGGTRVRSLDDLQDSKNYVAVGNTRFNKNIRYLDLENLTRRSKHVASPRIMEVKPVEHSRIQVSGKIRKIPTDVLTIFVYCNGNELQQAKRVTLTRSMLQRWDAILEEVTNRVGNLTTCLYTLDGTKITNPGSLQKGSFYVAVDKRFKKVDYGSQRPGFNTSPKQRSPGRPWTYWNRRLMPIIAPHRRGHKLRTGSDQMGRATMDNSVASSESEKSPKSYVSTMSNPIHNRPPPNRRPMPRKKTEKEQDSVFHAKPVKHRRNNGTFEEVDYDKDEGGVFKAKGGSREVDGAEIVEETKDTMVDLPIDQMEAEEVQDEEIEGETVKEKVKESKGRKANGRKNAKAPQRPSKRSPTPPRSSPTPPPRSPSPDPGDALSTHRSPTPNKTPTPPPKSAAANRTPRRSLANGTPGRTTSSQASQRAANQEEEPTDSVANQQSEDDKENKAAAKIQANYRGYQTRKNLSKDRKENRPLEEL